MPNIVQLVERQLTWLQKIVDCSQRRQPTTCLSNTAQATGLARHCLNWTNISAASCTCSKLCVCLPTQQ